MRPPAALLAALLLSACERGPRFVPLPGADGASIVIAAQHRGEVRAFARPIDGVPISLEAELDGDEAMALEALIYPTSLDALELSEGELNLLPLGDPSVGREFPEEATLFAAEVTRGEVSDWRRAVERSDALAAVRLPPSARRCAGFQVQQVVTSSRGDGRAAELLPDGSVLFGLDRGGVYRVDRAGVLRTVAADAALVISARDDAGGVWFLDRNQRLLLAESDGDTLRLTPFTQIPLELRGPGCDRIGSGCDGRGLAVRRTGAAVEAFVFLQHGRLLRYDGQSWASLTDFEPGGSSSWGQIVARASGEVVAVFSGDPRIARWSDGHLTFEEPTSVPRSSIAEVPGVGLLTAGLGQVLRQASDGGEWSVLEGHGIHLGIRAIEGYDGGFVIGGGTGLLNVYTAAGRFCSSMCLSFEPGNTCVSQPAPARFRENYVNRIVVGAEGELYLFGNERSDGVADVQILTPIP